MPTSPLLVLPCAVAIDSPTTQDRDDAFWLERRAATLVLTVAIANVAIGVPPGSPLDSRARRRGWTHYRAQERVDPLLPAAATARWSLGATADQAVLAVQAQIAPDGTIRATLHEARLARTHILSYAEVGALLAAPHPAEPAPADLTSMLTLAAQLAPRLLARRQARGALAVFDLAGGLTSTEEGALVNLLPEQRHIGYLIVQELMILANELIAGWAAARDLPILYRNHQARPLAPPRAQLLADLALAQQQPAQISPATLAGTWELVLGAAYYAPHIAGHYGLNLPVYTHATSPLRRYSDLRTQQILLGALRGADPPDPADLVELGADLTTREQARKAATAAALKAQAQARSYALGAEPDLGTLGADPFYQVLKVRLGAGTIPPVLVRETARRFAAGALGPREAALVLEGGTGLPSLQRAALDWLQARPEHTISLLLIQAQAGGPVPTFTAVAPESGPVAGFGVQAQVTGPTGPVTGAVRWGRSKQAAREQAALSVVCIGAGWPDRSADDPAARLPVAAPRPAGRPRPTDIPPAQALHEWVAQQGLELQVEFHPSGPPHAPNFTATCTIHGGSRAWCSQGHGATKARAKAAAAATLLAQLDGPTSAAV